MTQQKEILLVVAPYGYGKNILLEKLIEQGGYTSIRSQIKFDTLTIKEDPKKGYILSGRIPRRANPKESIWEGLIPEPYNFNLTDTAKRNELQNLIDSGCYTLDQINWNKVSKDDMEQQLKKL